MKRIAVLVLLFASLGAFGQSFYRLSQPFPNTTMNVCPVPSGGNPCPSPVNIYQDQGLTQLITQPVNIGATGNIGFWVSSATAQFTVQIHAPYNTEFIVGGGGGGGTSVQGTPNQINAVTGGGVTTVSFANPPTLPAGTVAAGPLNISGNSAAIEFVPDPLGLCAFYGAAGQHQLCDLAGQPVWNPTGAAGTNKLLLYSKYYDLINAPPPNGSLLFFNSITGQFELFNGNSIGSKAFTEDASGNPSWIVSGSGTVSNCTGAGNSYYSAAGTTVLCDTALTDNGAGALTSTQGALTASAPWMNHTGTWNAAIAFTDLISNITCTTAAANSNQFVFQVGGVTQFGLTYSASTCASPVLTMPVGGGKTQAGLVWQGDTAGGWFRPAANQWALTNGTVASIKLGPAIGSVIGNNGAYAVATTTDATGTIGTCWDASTTGVFRIDQNTACNDGLGILKSGNYKTQTGGNYTNATSTLTTFQSLAVLASTNYTFECDIMWQGSTTATTLQVGISTPTTPTAINADVTIYSNASGAETDGAITAAGGTFTGAVASAAATTFKARVFGTLENGISAGTLAVQAAAPVASTTITFVRGSYCRFW